MIRVDLAPVLALLVLVFSPLRAASADRRPVVAVFDVQVKRVKLTSGQLDMLTELLGQELGVGGIYQVMPPGDVKRTLLEQSSESYKSCYDEKCQIELGRQLPANKLVTTTMMKVGARCRVAASLYDLKRQTTDLVARETAGCKEEDLVQAIESVAAKLRAFRAGAAADKPEAGSSVPDVSEYERLATRAQAEDAKKREAEQKALADRQRYSAALEKAWEAVNKLAASKSMTHLARAGVVRKFLQDFERDNPHQAAANKLLAKLDKGEEPGGAGVAGIEWVHSAPAGIEFTMSEVTVAQYRACVQAGKCSAPKTKSEEQYCNWGYPDRDAHPVNCVDWNQATAFCEWAGGRLPTEQEWEAEASADGRRQYPWGDQAPSCDRAVWSEGGRGCGKDSTWPVCSKRAGDSVSGLCDLAGNVWEWTSSLYKNTGTDRVVRGGSWDNVYPGLLRASFRYWNHPTGRLFNFGLRCGRSSR
jgi:iron(II)-dependent oxidoreductase